MIYAPDNWVVIRITIDKPHYRVLGGWFGGYLQGDSWRMNSGITKMEEEEDFLNFYGTSGSCYKCNKNTYGLRMNISHIYYKAKEDYGDKFMLMPERTNWKTVDWMT